MRLCRLEVEHFAGVRAARVDFGPRLNVLHGPNELGKSSLVHAIRAALLLQDGARDHEVFVDWHADRPPSVTLTFETEPQRIWRVQKSFGGGADGSSLLEHSRDGLTFAQEAKGREVDGRLRELLRWGLETVGGKGRRRGQAESFLATALLGAQRDVTGILGLGLDDDRDPSGKERLTEALQALAEDPRFRGVVRAAQAKVDEAFTATGRRKGGRSSPWVQLRDDRRLVDEQRRLVSAQVEESEAAQARVAELHDRLAEAKAEERRARGHHAAVVAAAAQQQALADAEQAFAAATREHDRVRALHDAVTRTEALLTAARRATGERREAVTRANEANERAAEAVEAAATRVRALEGDDAEQKRRLREQEIDHALLALEGRQAAARRDEQDAERLGELDRKHRALLAEVERDEAHATQARALLAQAAAQTERDRRAEAALRRQVLVAARREAERSLASAREVHATAGVRKRAAEEQRERAAALREQASGAPGADEIAGLRQLATELRVAEEKLAVGLSVRVTPLPSARRKRALVARVIVDGGAPLDHALAGQAAAFDASARVRLTIPEVAEIAIDGGSAELQAEAAAQRAGWEQRARPLLSAAGVEDLDALAALRADADAALRQADALEAAAREADAHLLGAGDTEGEVARAHARLTAAVERLDALTGEATGADEQQADPEGALRDLEAALAQRGPQVAAMERELSRIEGALGPRRREAEALAKDLAAGGGTEPWPVLLERAREQLAAVRAERAARSHERDALRQEARGALVEAHARWTEAQAEAERLTAACAAAQAALDAAAAEAAGLEGELRIREAAAVVEDVGAARAALEACRASLAALPKPPIAADAEARAQAEARAEAAGAEVHALELKLREAEGALQQVGGQTVREKLAQLEEALVVLGEREQETEVDYGGWALLLQTLAEAEAEDAVHLGSALVEPVAARMAALTANRYGPPAIGPGLKAEGITLAGSRRELDQLSMGTRDQLATLLRLSIAEAIGSALVLDDHLTQTDPQRMSWLRDELRRVAERVQIVVFTCRPADYLLPDELAGPHHDATAVRAVRLASVLTRSATD